MAVTEKVFITAGISKLSIDEIGEGGSKYNWLIMFL